MSADDVREFLIEYFTIHEDFTLRWDAISSYEDLFALTGIDGDDVDEFWEEFLKRFEVDMSNYQWQFHHGSEGCSPINLFWRYKEERCPHIPITIKLLAEAVEKGVWPVDYPVMGLNRSYEGPSIRILTPLVLVVLFYLIIT